MTPRNDQDLYEVVTEIITSGLVQIEILPLADEDFLYCSEEAAVALSKPSLIRCFVVARTIFFRPESPCGDRFRASAILLLWDPNHISAANVRRKYISNGGKHANLVKQELMFLASLLTSPLPKHPKSSVLWAHRRWLHDLVQNCEEEMRIVFKAAEQHSRNYYAWNYARSLHEATSQDGSINQTKKWCFMHPRDISGWAFLAWLLRRQNRPTESAEIRAEVQTFCTKYSWQGESVSWFCEASCQ